MMLEFFPVFLRRLQRYRRLVGISDLRQIKV
jgi:hypothetical protein